MVNKYFYFNTHIEIYLYGLRVLSSSEIIFSVIEENAINRMILLVNILKYTLFSSITLKQYPPIVVDAIVFSFKGHSQYLHYIYLEKQTLHYSYP